MIERRSGPRRRVFKGGLISFGGAGIDCTVRNISPRGAALDIASIVGIPDRFSLRSKRITSSAPAGSYGITTVASVSRSSDLRLSGRRSRKRHSHKRRQERSLSEAYNSRRSAAAFAAADHR